MILLSIFRGPPKVYAAQEMRSLWTIPDSARFEGDIKLGDLEGKFNGTIDLHRYEYSPKVTALHSVNAWMAYSENKGDKTYNYYNPTLEELPFDLSKKVSSCTDDVTERQHHFAAVWDGYFDAEVNFVDEEYTTKMNRMYADLGVNNRAIEILGPDILLMHEAVNLKRGSSAISVEQKSVRVTMDDPTVTKYGAISAIYKSLGEYKYRNKITFCPDMEMDLENSPVGSMLSGSLLAPGIDNSAGQAWCWIGRNNANDYLHQAMDDGIIQFIEQDFSDGLKAEEPAKSLKESYKDLLTLGEFCVYVRDLADIYGEPIMTEKERTMLIQFYGAKLPYGLDANTYDAVEYLTAKGILNPEEIESIHFSDYLTVATMCDILMRLKDTDSRYTMKEITPTIDVELANKGYYESICTSEFSPCYDFQYDYDVAGYCDYIITSKLNKTMYVVGRKPALDSMCLRSWERPNYTWAIGPADVIDGNSYHFKLQTNLPDEFVRNGKVKVSWTDKKKRYFTIDYLGGEFRYTAKSWRVRHGLERTPHTRPGYIGSEQLSDDVDRPKRKVAQGMSAMDANDENIPVVFRVTNPKNNLAKIKFNEKTLENILGSEGSGTLDVGEGSRAETWTFSCDKTQMDSTRQLIVSITGPKSLECVKEQLTSESGAGTTVHKLFMRSKNQDILINYDWLASTGIVYQYRKLKGDVICLSTRYNNVYICPSQRYVIVGQVMYKITDNDQVLYYEKDGEMFVSLQAMLGWSGSLNTMYNNAQSGQNTTIEVPDLWYGVTDQVVQNKVIVHEEVHYPIQAFYKGGGKRSDTVYFMQEQSSGSADPNKDPVRFFNFNFTYGPANFLIYQDMQSEAYLFVFKLKNGAYGKGKKKQHNEAVEILNRTMGLDKSMIPKEWYVASYDISVNNTEANGDQNMEDIGVIAERSGSSDLAATYLYKIPAVTSGAIEDLENWDTKYYKTGRHEYILPFMEYYVQEADERVSKLKIYNTNVNRLTINGKKLDYGYTTTLLREASSNDAGNWQTGKWCVDNKLRHKKKLTTIADDANVPTSSALAESGGFIVGMTPAPAGCLQQLFGFWLLKDKEYKPYVRSTNVYYGTCPLYIRGMNELFLRDGESQDMPVGKISEDTFLYDEMYVLSTSVSGYILGIKQDVGLLSTDSPLVVQDEIPGLKSGTPVIDFDWENFKFTNLIHDFDSGLSIILIACLGLIPRIFMFVCIFLIALAVIKDSPIVIMFAKKFVDPYKLLTFGGRDINTINAYRLLWDSVLGLGIFGLFMNGTILKFLAWCAECVAALVNY